MATLPCSQAAHCATASRSLLPGIEALFWAIIWSSVVRPAGLTSCAFMSASKNLPPFARNCCRKLNWLPGLPNFRKCAAP